MGLLRYFPQGTKIDFVKARFFAFSVTGLLFAIGIVSLFVRGLEMGIDFQGGVLIEASSKERIDIGAVRSRISALGMGDVQVQYSGGDKGVMIRAAKPPGDEAAQAAAVTKIKNALGPGFEIRRQEFVGPKVSDNLFRDGMIATGLALLAIAIYVAFRFEWQFGVAALVATGHDVFMAVGLYSVLGFEFDLVSIATLLTLAGYSINDTIVVFDRLRENMRRYKRTDFKFLINISTNQMLSRTILTSTTTALSILPLLIFGSDSLFAMTVAILFGILIGTYSSIYVAASLLIYLPAIRQRANDPKDTAAQGA
ncbi:MAG: protein translocase subunit SecF [Rhodospirillaceae bacterium]|nr:protein translocase subunit SecF [Rhodospirillaceae bacterium]